MHGDSREKTIEMVCSKFPQFSEEEISKRVSEMINEWDPNFTKVTIKEKELLDKSDEEMKNGEYISEEDFWA